MRSARPKYMHIPDDTSIPHRNLEQLRRTKILAGKNTIRKLCEL